METLQGIGFVVNPYDLYIANCNLNSKTCTVVWYINNTKISHEDSEVKAEIIQKINAYFGRMSVTQGRMHSFIGINIKYNVDKIVSLSM